MPETMHRMQREIQTDQPSLAAEAMVRTHVIHELSVEPGDADFVFEERVRGTDLLSLESTNCSARSAGPWSPAAP